MAIVLGITGGIGTGKSTVLKIFADLGAETLSADEIAREVLAKDTPAYYDTVERFGRSILTADGEIDRRVLGEIVFNDVSARKELEDITHPRIIAQTQERINQFRSNPPASDAVLAVEIPLLIECGLENIVDEVLVVAAEQETQLNRLISRSGLTAEEALRRINAQMPIDEKIKRADRVIWNDGSLECLESSVRSIFKEIRLL